MTHVCESELLDVLEGVAPADCVKHVEACEQCRAEVEQMRRVLARTSAIEIPEPSPLFWTHFSERVRQSVNDAAQGSRWRWTDVFRRGPALAATVVVALLLIAIGTSRLLPRNPPASNPAAVAPDRRDAAFTGAAMPSPEDVELDEAWALVRTVADEVRWEEVNEAGLTARPGSAERAVLDLSDAERGELAAVLQEELKRSGV